MEGEGEMLSLDKYILYSLICLHIRIRIMVGGWVGGVVEGEGLFGTINVVFTYLFTCCQT